MIREGIHVTFSAGLSAGDHCSCDLCGAVTRVIKARIPDVRFHDGKKLSAKYSQMWMCESCRDRLVSVITIPFPEAAKECDVEVNPTR